MPSRDFFGVPESDIKDLVSHLTVVGGRIVHGDGGFAGLAPPMPKAANDWAPTNAFGGYWRREPAPGQATRRKAMQPFADCCAKPCAVHGHAHTQKAGSQMRRCRTKRASGARWGCACWL